MLVLIFEKEIRALLRASKGRTITIVFPLVTKISEKDYLLNLANDSLNELDSEKVAHGNMEISFMIETPAAVLLAPAIAKKDP